MLKCVSLKLQKIYQFRYSSLKGADKNCFKQTFAVAKSSVEPWLASLSAFSHTTWHCTLSCTLSCAVTGSEPRAAPVVPPRHPERELSQGSLNSRDSSHTLWPAGWSRKLISRLFWIKSKTGKVLLFSDEYSVQSYCSDTDECCCRSCTCISNDCVTRDWKESSRKAENELISTSSQWIGYQVNQ